MGLLKDLQGLNAAYAEIAAKEAYTVTAADKKGNTPAYQGYKAGKKNVKTGKPLYKAADHLKKEDRESKLWDEVAKMLSELHELRGVKYKVVPLNEHHEKDADGKVIEHDDGTPSSLDEDEKYGYDKDGNSLNPKDKKKAKKKGDKPERWQDDDGDGKWYEPGVDVKKEQIEIAKSLLESGKFSEEEVKGMLWDEGYQRNPEKGEKEDRKYERVRGERTPMPPRGNKRREDFEKWYAANVR